MVIAMPRKLKCECGDCPTCDARERMRARYHANIEESRQRERERYARQREQRLAAQQRWRESNPEVAAESMKAAKAKWAARNPEKRKAQTAVGNAVRDGKLVRGTCERLHEGTCKGRIEAHHEDYSKPLEVRWLCSRHHGQTRRAAA
jgi:hypothetical protein